MNIVAALIIMAVTVPFTNQTVQEKTPPQGTDDIDLLSLIEVDKHVLRGVWELKNNVLVTKGLKYGRIEIPYRPPEEYDIQVVLTGMENGQQINLGLAVGDVQFCAVLGARLQRGTTSGLDMINNKSFHQNETTFVGPIFSGSESTFIVASVRRDRISVSVDGKSIIDWKMDIDALSLYPKWAVPHRSSLFLGSWSRGYEVRNLALKPILGRGITLTGKEPVPAPNSEAPLEDIGRSLNEKPEGEPTRSHFLASGLAIICAVLLMVITISIFIWAFWSKRRKDS